MSLFNPDFLCILDQATFVTNYLPLALFPILYVGARFYYRQPLVKPSEMDFTSGLAEIEADS
jgi:amino acid transporter